MQEKHDEIDWEEGYLKNVWCKYKRLISPEGEMFIVAKQDSAIKVFKLSKKTVEECKDRDLNDVMEDAEEVDEIPDFIPKKWLER